MTDHSHQWVNTHKILGGRLSETCGCGAYCVIEFPTDGPPSRNILPEGDTGGFARQEDLTDDEEAYYRAILGR